MAALDASKIRYLIVGGIAVGFHAEPRYTKDLKCLAEFGAPVGIITPEELLQHDFVFHFGVPPWRIDILTSIPGVDFDQAYEERVELPLGEYAASCISREWLIRAKRASGRPQDLLDLRSLGDAKEG